MFGKSLSLISFQLAFRFVGVGLSYFSFGMSNFAEVSFERLCWFKLGLICKNYAMNKLKSERKTNTIIVCHAKDIME